MNEVRKITDPSEKSVDRRFHTGAINLLSLINIKGLENKVKKVGTRGFISGYKGYFKK